MRLLQGDCLEVMKGLEPHSVDLVLCDLPYGTTQCKWDTVIPFVALWERYFRVVKHSGAVVLFGAEPFSSLLRCSNLGNYKYDWVWQKDKGTGHLNAKKQPLRKTERISVFYSSQCTYNPQITDKPKDIRPAATIRKNIDHYGSMDKPSVRGIPDDKAYPVDVLVFRRCFGDKGKSNHPTEKPVALLEYLIRTYSNEGDLVLDNCMGSGSTGVACVNTKRRFTGIEKDEIYFQTAQRRISEAHGLLQKEDTSGETGTADVADIIEGRR